MFTYRTGEHHGCPQDGPADGDGNDALMCEAGDIGRSRGLEDVLCEGDDGEESETEAAGGGSGEKHLHHNPSLIDELTPDGGRLENCSKEMDERETLMRRKGNIIMIEGKTIYPA